MLTLGQWLNKLLMWDLFLVFFFFAWFAIALIGESLHLHLGWNLWQQLWQPLIQPVLGLFMAGAIASGILSQINKRFPKKENPSP